MLNKSQYRNRSIIFRTATLIFMVLILGTASYAEQEDGMNVINDNSLEGDRLDRDNVLEGDRLEYESLHQRYPNKGKMLQGFQEGSTSSNQTVDEFFNGTDTQNNLDAADRTETVTITPPTGYSGTSGHFNISEVIAVQGNYTKEGLVPVDNFWDSKLTGDYIQAVSANFSLQFRSNLTSVYVDLDSWASPTGNISIQGDKGSGEPDGTPVAGPISFGSWNGAGQWDKYAFDDVLDPGNYTVVLEQTSPANDTEYFKWYRVSNIIYPPNDETVYTRSFSGSWSDEPSWDIPLIIESIAYEDFGSNPRNFTGANPSAADPSIIDFRYDGVAISNYTQISMNTAIQDHVITMNTSVEFDVAWFESFDNDANPFDTNPLVYNVTDVGQAYWNSSFTANDLSSVIYTVQDRTFNVTKESDWTLEDVYQDSAVHASTSSGTTFVTIDAGTITGSDTWTITCSAPNYILDVWAVNATTLQNITEANLGQQIVISTSLLAGYDSSSNWLNVSLLDPASTQVNSTLWTPSTNPFNATYTLNTGWSNGSYTIKSLYNNDTEVGLEQNTLIVYTPTYLAQETVFTSSTVVIGTPMHFGVYYNDSNFNQAVTGATVTIDPDWTASSTASYNSTYRFYQNASIDTTGVSVGSHDITVNASRLYYRSQNNTNFSFQFISPTNLTVHSFSSQVNYTHYETLEAEYRNATDDTPILGATLNAEIDGSSNLTMTDPNNDGIYNCTFDASAWGAPSGHNFVIYASMTNYATNTSSGDSITVVTTPTEFQGNPAPANESTIILDTGEEYNFTLLWRDSNQTLPQRDLGPTVNDSHVSYQTFVNGNHNFSFSSASPGKFPIQIELETTGLDSLIYELTLEVYTPTNLTIHPFSSQINYTHWELLQAEYRNATDDTPILGATLNAEIDGSSNLTMTDPNNDGIYNCTFDASAWGDPGPHLLKIYADKTGVYFYANISSNYPITVVTTPTELQRNPAPVNGSTIVLDVGAEYNFTLFWRDFNQTQPLEDSSPSINDPTHISYLTFADGNHNFSFSSSIAGQFPIQITLNGTGVSNVTYELTFEVNEFTNLTMWSYRSPISYAHWETLRVEYLNATDSSPITNATLNIEFDGSTNYTMTGHLNGTYSYLFDASSWAPGSHTFKIYADKTNFYANMSSTYPIYVDSVSTYIAAATPVSGSTIGNFDIGASHTFTITWEDANQSSRWNDFSPGISNSRVIFQGATNGVHTFRFSSSTEGSFQITITLSKSGLDAAYYVITYQVYGSTTLSIKDIDSSAIIGDDIEVEVRLTNDRNGNGISGVTVRGETDWGEEDSATTDSNGYATLEFDTSDGDRGVQDVDVWVNQGFPYRGDSDSEDTRLIEPTRLTGLFYTNEIAFNDSTAIAVTYETDGGSKITSAIVTLTINETVNSMTEISSGTYSYTFYGTEWDLGNHAFTIAADKGDNYDDSNESGQIVVLDTPTLLKEAAIYASSVSFSDVDSSSTFQMAYTDGMILYLYYNDTVNNAGVPNAVVDYDWVLGELPLSMDVNGANYSFSVVGDTIGQHSISIQLAKYGHQTKTFDISFNVVSNPLLLSTAQNMPSNRTLSIEYTEETMFELYLADTNHSIPISTTPTVDGWSNYTIHETTPGSYMFTFYGDQVTADEGQLIDIQFEKYGYVTQSFNLTFNVKKRTVHMSVEVESLNVTAGESIVVHSQLNFTNGDPVPNVEVVAIFTVEFNITTESTASNALSGFYNQVDQFQSFNVSGTTNKQGQVTIPYTTEDRMLGVQITVVFEADGTKATSTSDYDVAIHISARPIPPPAQSLLDALIQYWYLTLAVLAFAPILVWYVVRRTRQRMVHRVDLDRKIKQTYDFVQDIVGLDAIIGILRDATSFYDLMIGEELDPQLYSSFLTALRTYASSLRSTELEEDVISEEIEEKAHALMGDKEYYIATGETVSFAFLFSARIDDSGQWQSISPITQDAAREAVEEVEMQFEKEIQQFQEYRDLSTIPRDHIYLVFSEILGLDFLRPHHTTGRGESPLTKDEQWALRVAKDIEIVEDRLLLPLVAQRLIGEGLSRERAIYALQQLRVKDIIETTDRHRTEAVDISDLETETETETDHEEDSE